MNILTIGVTHPEMSISTQRQRERFSMKRAREQANLYLSKVRDELVVFERLVLEESIAGWIISFHAQQIVEKSLKALLSLHGVHFRKTHDLRELIDLLSPTVDALPDELLKVEYLSPYGAQARYEETPFEESFTRSELKALVDAFFKWVEERSQTGD